MLCSLLGKIWQGEVAPADWKIGHLVELPKKGDRRDRGNYKGTMLLSVPGKVLCRVILERLRAAVDDKLRDNQAGLRRERSCIDQQSIEWNSSLYVNFVDYEKAFDSLDRETLWELIMRHYAIPEKFLILIHNIYEGMTCKAIHADKISTGFEVLTGGRQGCILSTFLFLMAIDWITRTTTANLRETESSGHC